MEVINLKKTSTDYARNRNYKQITVTFDLDNKSDAVIYHYLRNVVANKNALIKELVKMRMFEEASQ